MPMQTFKRRVAMVNFKFETKKRFFVPFLLMACLSCVNSELMIKPIGGRGGSGNGIYSLDSYDDENPCIEYQYYTIANYKRITPNSLYKVLNAYVHSVRSFESAAENMLRGKVERGCSPMFAARFYEKSLLVDYQKHISDAIRYDDAGSIYKYNHKLVAQIFGLDFGDEIIFYKVLYNNSLFYYKDHGIVLSRSDTIKVRLGN
jgi:hypothetical protein